MKGYLYVCLKNNKNISYKNKIEKIFSRFYGKETSVKETKVRNHLLYNFSNENDNLEQYNINNIHYFGLSGYFTSAIKDTLEGLILSPNADKYVLDIGGIFSISHLNTQNNIFKAWNNITRVEPIYWSESNDVIVVGSKALLVHLIAMNFDKPEYDISAFASFLNNGYYADENTPFLNLNILPVHSRIKVQNNLVTISPIDDTLENLYTISADQKIYDDITDDFINSFKPLLKHDQKISLGLTGGKDSRLILAALNNLDAELNLFTNGYSDNPDVIVAKQISNLLNKEHSAKSPLKNNKNSITEDIGLKAKRMIQNTDGMLFAYEGMPVPEIFKHSKVQLGGQGGELLRGGFAKGLKIESRNRLEQVFNLRFAKYQKYLNPELSKHFSIFNEKYIQNNLEHHSIIDVLNKHYLEYRTGRWSASARAGYTLGFYSYAPMFDNKLVRKAQLLETKYGADDSLIYNILMRLEPKLLNVPFSGDRWNFEKNKPFSKYDTKNWLNRRPINSTTKRGNFNWRKNILKNMKEEFYDTIFSSSNNRIFDIINKQQLENIFDYSDNERIYVYDNFLWSVFTASHLLSNNWFEESFNMSKTVEIKIPKNSYDTKEKSIPKAEIVPMDLLSSNNNYLSISKIDEYSSAISWNNIINSNLYIRIFDNSFNTPPTINTDLADIEKSEKVSLEFEIEKHKKDDFILKIYIMQYDDEKVVSKQSKTVEIIDRLETYSFEVSKHEKSKYFKPAIQILSKNSNGSFTIQGIILNK